MKTAELTSWQTFKAALEQHPDLSLQFQYAEGRWVDASYHITEIKQAAIVSVDCGERMNTWTEIIVQLREPPVQDSGRAMQVSKALSIVKIVERSLSLNPLGTVKIEFGNSQFDTRQMHPDEFIPEGDNLIVNLIPDFTQCKATGRGGSCGTGDSGEECCEPAAKAEKTKLQMANPAGAGQVCEPGSGCC